MRRTSLGANSESSSSESYHNLLNAHPTQENHRRIDVNAAKNPAVHRDAGPLGLILTVLRSCPLYDTIAILIVLLQIPPTFLSIIHLLFATLTFVPPSTSPHSGFSFTDIFEGTLGTPSVATIVAVDCLALLVFVFLWTPLQDIAFDLAQTVIALTLGGGTSGRDGGFNNVVICFGVIGLSHFARNGGIKHSGLRILFGSSGIDSDDPLEPSLQVQSHGTYSWIRNVFAVHILAQGVVRYVRDWYVRRERRDSLLASMVDPEAAKGSVSHIENTTNEASNGTASNSPDMDSLGLISSNNDKLLNPKRKRKASAQVRSRQPLWAALASTKIVMAKEYETSRTASESAGTNATDINNLGNAPFTSEADRIWITYVGFDEVCFNTSYFPSHNFVATSTSEDDVPDTPGIDKSKPFFVRVNRTVWQPTRINAVKDVSSEPTAEQSWSGEIFGLAPMSSYECDFISTVDGSVIFSTNIKTMQAPTASASSLPTISPSVQRSARPDSPTTTLKNSIATAEAKLYEERNRQKRERKELKAKINSTRKEIDKLTGNISSSGGNDDRLRQKVQQSNLHAKQADEAVANLLMEMEHLESLPEDDVIEWKDAQGAWQSQKDMHKQCRNDFVEAKQAADREVQAMSTEVATYQQKRERLQSRIKKLIGEHDRITDANARGLDEAQRKATERDAKEAERARAEMMYLERLDVLGPQILEYQQNLSAIWATIHAMQQAEYIAQQAHMKAHNQPSPTTVTQNLHTYDVSDGATISSYPWNPPTFVPGYNPSMLMNTFNVHHNNTTRGRSSSMHSNISKFTSSSLGDEPEPPLPYDARGIIERRRQKSEGSGSVESGSGSGSCSVGDPKSPIAGLASTATWGSGWDEK